MIAFELICFNLYLYKKLSITWCSKHYILFFQLKINILLRVKRVIKYTNIISFFNGWAWRLKHQHSVIIDRVSNHYEQTLNIIKNHNILTIYFIIQINVDHLKLEKNILMPIKTCLRNFFQLTFLGKITFSVVDWLNFFLIKLLKTRIKKRILFYIL